MLKIKHHVNATKLEFFSIGVIYKTINSKDCVSKGMKMITTKEECEEAAKFLGKSDTTADEYQFKTRAHGCINKDYPSISSNRLVWAEPQSHPHANRPCGSKSFICICAKQGKIVFHL